jgi:hypothetical protein
MTILYDVLLFPLIIKRLEKHPKMGAFFFGGIKKMKPKFFVFARTSIVLFAISHVLSYFVSSIQTWYIIKEVKKAQRP